MFSETMAKNGIETLTNAAVKAFASDAMRREIEQQEAVFKGEKDITNVLSTEQEKAKAKGEPFSPAMDIAKERGETTIKFGVGQRLKGAYANYKAGNELDCIRHLLIAMSVLCEVMNWKKAANYLNQQNIYLLDQIKKDR